MGGKKYSRNRKKQKKYRKKRKAYQQTHLTNRIGTVVPDIYSTKLKFAQVNSEVSSALGYTFRGNSVYDPQFSTGGLQPKGFDQLKALYNNYRVRGCSLKVSFFNNKSTALVVGIYPSLLSTPTPNADDLITETHIKHKLLAPARS